MNDLAALQGYENLGELGKVRRVPYSYVLEFSNEIPNGGSATVSKRIEVAGSFQVASWQFVAWSTALIGTNPIGTPFLREPTARTDALPMPSLAQVFLEFSVNSARFSDRPVSAMLGTGDGREPGYALNRLMLGGGMTFDAALTNNSGYGLKGQLVLVGSKLIK